MWPPTRSHWAGRESLHLCNRRGSPRDAGRHRRRLRRGAVRRGSRAGSAARAAAAARRHVGAGGVRPPAATGGAQPACRRRGHLSRRRDVRPLRAGADRLDLAAVRVPDAVHAVPARDLAGRPSGDVRVPDRDLGADRPAGGQCVPVRGAVVGGLRGVPGEARQRALEVRGVARRSSALAGDALDLLGRVRVDGRRGAVGRSRRDRSGGAGRGGRRRHLRGDPPAAQLPRHRRGPRPARRRRQAHGRGGGLRGGSVDAGHPPAAGRARRGRGRGRGAVAGQPAGLRWAVVRVLRRRRALHPADAGADRGGDRGRRGQARVRAHAADARAAHPAREGHAQHLHRPSAERADGRDLPVVARPPGHRRAGRADAAAHRVRARSARRRADQPGTGRARVRRAGAGPGQHVPPCAGGRDQPRLPARARLPGVRGRPARGDHRAADEAGHRSVDVGRGRCSRGSGGVSESPHTPDTRTIYERSRPGRRAFVPPQLDVPEVPVDELLPSSAIRREPPALPEVSEPEIVRHYNGLSKKNFDLDTGFYPLGSCTMKHNPKVNERVAALPGHARLHPLQDPRYAQGALELMWRLQQQLSEISGLPHVSLQPSAGSHGELAGLLLTRAYHEDRGEKRTKVLTPDTAHGTNPASVTMAGFDVVKVGTAPDGGVDLDDLRVKADSGVACLMLTNPNTLGLFDRNIEEIATIVHGVGATLYYDGANLNAVMGLSRPGDMGFDIVHFNLHKSFTQPHGGGGPGAGPIAVSERIEPYLPRPQIVRRSDDEGCAFTLDEERPKSIGKLRGFQGNYGVFVRSYAYIRSLGAEGLREASEVAVLNANYLLALLKRAGVAEYLPVAYDRVCMHEFVLSGAPMKRELGIRTLDLAKRLLDFGVHPPTVYFPLLVDEALLIEPTETETKETLDRFAAVVAEILREAARDPEIARTAPHTTPVRRLDEAAAARRPVVRQPL